MGVGTYTENPLVHIMICTRTIGSSAIGAGHSCGDGCLLGHYGTLMGAATFHHFQSDFLGPCGVYYTKRHSVIPAQDSV